MVKVLIVEDCESDRIYIEGIVASLGYHVRSISNPTEFRNEINSFEPDVVLLDIHFEGYKLSGIELAEWVLMETAPGIIFITAHEDEKTAKRAISLNIDNFINKPPTRSELLVAIPQAIKLKEYLTDRLCVVNKKLFQQAVYSFVHLDQVWKITSVKNDSKAILHLTDGREILYGYVLKKLEKRLPPKFMRVAPDTIVNESFINYFIPADRHLLLEVPGLKSEKGPFVPQVIPGTETLFLVTVSEDGAKKLAKFARRMS